MDLPTQDSRSQLGKTVLEVRNLSTSFQLRTGMLEAVADASFTLTRGRTLCIVGESGSGKSVTARSILRIVPPPGRVVAGEMILHQAGGTVDLAKLDPRGEAIRRIRGREIAMIFQEPMSSLSPVHTIGFQIGEALRLHHQLAKKERRARVIELLRRVEIPNPEMTIDRFPFEYSGGMRQRAMIAMALACNPAVLIADEPTTALDVTTQAEILDLIRELQRDFCMAVMFITHDMGVVAEIADDVCVMFRGRIVEQGSVDQIFHAPQHAYTRMLIGTARKLEHRAPMKVRADEVAATATSQTRTPLLEVTGLYKQFVTTKGFLVRQTVTVDAVKNASLTLGHGETLGIVGESGSGKTTLGRCLLRMIEPSAGSIRYRRRDGSLVDVTDLDPGRTTRHLRRDADDLPGSVRLAEPAHDGCADHWRATP